MLKKKYQEYVKNNNLTFIDLFAGIGGFRISLSEFGEECVFTSEWDKYASVTYEHNFKDKPYGDITQINEKDIPSHNILCAGFPCQAFSISGKQNGFNDTRGTLFFDIVRIVNEHKPEVLFLENVKNLAKHDNGKTLSTILRVLDEIGYDTYYQVLNASHYGVPQSRERVYFVCFRKDLKIKYYEFPKPTLENISVFDILEKNIDISKYEIKRNDVTLKKDVIENKKLFNEKTLKPIRVGTISKGGQGERIYSPHGHAITLSAYGGGIAGKTGAYFIDNKIRQLTTRECLRVQGFPEYFEFPKEVSTSQSYKLCGNSVSVPVISKIYKSILGILIENNISMSKSCLNFKMKVKT